MVIFIYLAFSVQTGGLVEYNDYNSLWACSSCNKKYGAEWI